MKFGEYIQTLFPTKAGVDSVQDWREYLLHYVMGALLFFGTLVAIPSIGMLLAQGLWPAAVADVVLIAAAALIWRSERLGHKAKSWGLCVILYLLSLALLLMMGPTSQIYLMTSPVLAAILLGSRPAVLFLGFNTVTLFSVGLLGFTDFQLRGLEISPWAQWLTIALNFAFVNAIITLSISLLLRGLEKSFDKVREADRAKSEFLANMSHEIRTPMNAVLGMLKLTQSTHLTAQQQDYIGKCDTSARALLALINDILDFSKIEADKLVIDNHAFEIEQMLRDLAAVLSANNQKEGLEVLFDVDVALPAVVSGDAMRITQVLTNLGSNAIKFTAAGQVTIGLKAMEHIDDGFVHIRFSVADTGIGIAPDQVQRIFKGFTQAEGSTTRKYGGTGLGLVISRRLVKAMGGRLELLSEPGQGAFFYFTLRLPIENSGEIALSQEQGPVVKTIPHLLLIDADAPSAARLQNMIQQWPATCDWAESEAAALTALDHRASAGSARYDAIYLNATLAMQQDWQTARNIEEVAKSTEGAKPPIILLSPSSSAIFTPAEDAASKLFGSTIVMPATTGMLREAFLHALRGNSSQPIKGARSHTRQGLVGLRILVVEDNAINQQVAKELLAAQGAVVDLADNGQMGVHAVTSAAPAYDAVLMDVQMPVMDGLAATRAIRALPAYRALPIIGLTANALVSDREACLQAGMDDHVGKPFDLPTLVALLNKRTGRRSVESSTPVPYAEADRYALKNESIDLAPAIQRMGDLTSLYLTSAQAYAASLKTLDLQIQNQLERSEFRNLAALAHTYKSTAGTLGLVQLAAHLAALEKACSDDAKTSAVSTMASKTQTVVQAALDALESAVQHIGGNADIPSQAIDPGRLVPVLETLRELLVSEDFSALETFAENRQAFTSAPVEQLEQLEQALQDLDLATALQACDAMLANCQTATPITQ